MKLGVDVNITGALALPQNVMRLARIVEDLGYDSIWVDDHVVRPVALNSRYPYNETGEFMVGPDHPILEPLMSLGVLAGATTRVRLGLAAMVVPYRNPVLFTKMLTTLDVYSGGRVVLGTGVGWMEEEFEALAAPPFHERGGVTDEYLQIYKILCTEDRPSFNGRYYRLPEISFYPKPVQRPYPPILVGGLAAPALRRAARLGDGWFAVAQDPPEVRSSWERVKELCLHEGRDPSRMQLAFKMSLSLGQEILRRDGTRLPGSGSSQQVLDDIRRYEEAGVQEMVVRYRRSDFEEELDQVRRLAVEVRDRL